MCFGRLLERGVEFLPEFADERFLQEDIYGCLQSFSLYAAGTAKGVAGFIIHYFACFRFPGLDGIKVTADWLFPTDLPVVKGLLDAAFDDPVIIPDTISAHLSTDGRRYPAEFSIILITAPGFYFPHAGRCQVGLYNFVNLIETIEFLLFERGAGVPILTAAAFTFQEIADKLLADNFVTYQDIIYGYHNVGYKYRSFPGCRSGRNFPPEGIDQMFHILFEKRVDDAQRILIRGGIEIQGAAQEMTRSIGKEELIGSRSVAPDMEKDAADAVGGLNDGLIDGTGLDAVLEGHFKGVVPQLVEFVWPYLFVTDVNACVESRKVDIDPIGILRQSIEKAGVFNDAGINRVFKGIGIPRFIEDLVLM